MKMLERVEMAVHLVDTASPLMKMLETVEMAVHLVDTASPLMKMASFHPSNKSLREWTLIRVVPSRCRKLWEL
jgi:hypothetical protein